MALTDAARDHPSHPPNVFPPDYDDMELSVGSMGSEVYRWRFAPHQLDAVMAYDWSQLGRRVWIDPEEGLVSLVVFSSTHESTSSHVYDVIQRAAEAYGEADNANGSTTLREVGSVSGGSNLTKVFISVIRPARYRI